VRGRLTVAGCGLGLIALAACSSSSSSSDPVSTTASTTATATGAGNDVRGKRYCEVLLVTLANGTGTGAVYNSYPMNDCPQTQWAALDAGTIAKDAGVPLAVLNGPRYWLMDTIKNYGPADTDTRTFGGIEMTKRANVDIGPVATARVPYTTHDVNRSVVFSFDAGTTIYELTAPDGTTYVMQTWSQQVDPTLVEAGLAAIGPRLELPEGWKFSSRTLTTPLVVDTRNEPAHVLQDDLGNSYSKLAGA
jgi:hypothetical protein